jgi:hypothetical protein
MAENIRYFCPEYPTNIRKLHPSPATVRPRARPGRLSALSVFHSRLGLYGAFVWACRALNIQNRRFPARAGRRPRIAACFCCKRRRRAPPAHCPGPCKRRRRAARLASGRPRSGRGRPRRHRGFGSCRSRRSSTSRSPAPRSDPWHPAPTQLRHPGH